MPASSFDPSSPTPSEHHAFLHRLAVGLVRDEHAADDLVQEAWLGALSRPGSARPVGLGWLVTTIRHLAFNRSLAERRRAARELQSASHELVNDAEVGERLEQQTLVLGAVRQLPEALRTAIYLRYFEELGPAQISERTGANLATVKSRLARAREVLRQALARSSAGDEWLRAIILPLALTSPRAVPVAGTGVGSTLGALAMSTIGKGVIATTLLLCAVYAWTPRGIPPNAPDRSLSAEPSSVVVEPARSADPRTDEARRASVNTEPVVEPSGTEVQVALETEEREIAGLVIDSLGLPLSDATVVLQSGNAPRSSAISSADGTFVLDSQVDAGEVVIESETLVTLFAGRFGEATRGAVLVIGAPRAEFGGTVLSDQGVPLEGAQLTIRLPDGIRRRIPHVLDSCRLIPAGDKTDDQGRFRIQDGYAIAGAYLETTLAGYVPRKDALTSLSQEARLVLHRPGTAEDALHGIVLDERGLPVEGARVCFGAEVTFTDATGSFQLLRASADRSYSGLRDTLGAESRTLCAVARGHLPAAIEVPLALDTGQPLWPDGVVLQFQGTPLEISGRVLDPSGAALGGIRVFLEEATLFTITEGSKSIENLLGGDPDERITMFETEPDGSFTLGGLQDRTYTLVAFDWDTAVQTHSEPIAAGSRGVELVLDRGETWSRVAGRVSSPSGQVLPGVEVHVFTDATNFLFEGRFVRTSNLRVSGVVTDEEGRFELFQLPKRHVYLLLMGEEIVLQRVDLESPLWNPRRATLDPIELVASRRAHLQVTLAHAGDADEVQLLDGAGEPLELRIYQGKPGPPMRRMPFFGGQTDVLAVDEAARTLLYYRAGAVVRRRSLSLQVGFLNEL